MSDGQDLARAKWRSSGIPDDVAEKLGMRQTTPEETQALVGQAVPGLLLPYHDFTGKPTGFYRVRLLAPVSTGFGQQAAKPLRYLQPPDTLNGVYTPPVINWPSVIADPSVEIVICEGECKAACACSHGIPTLGLGGVDVWRSQARGLDVLPELKEVIWKGRLVTIVYDSDAATNTNVLRAQRQLADALLAMGAKPKVASLPSAPDGKKQGLDDYVVAAGVPALLEAIDAAEPPGEAHALWKLNEEILYLRKEGLVLVRDEGQLLTPAAFTSHAYANRQYMEEHFVTREGDTKPTRQLKKKPLAPRWLTWESRFEAQNLTYRPAAAKICLDEKGRHVANIWGGWGCEPKAGDAEPWKWLLNLAFDGAPAEREWFERWCAYPLQNPGAKLYTAALLWSRIHGIGKTLVGYCLLKLYGQNGVEVSTKELKSPFNSWGANRQFVLGDEITGDDNRSFADQLKNLITGHTIEINTKFVPQYTLPNVMNFLFTSNHEDAFFLEDDDRRFFVHNFSGQKAKDEQYAAVDKWVNSPDGPPALFHHLLELPLGDWNPKAAAPRTKSKSEMIRAAKSELATWCEAAFADPEGVIHSRIPGLEVVEAEDMLRLFDPDKRSRVTVPGMAKALSAAGFKQCLGGEQVRADRKLRRLWAVGVERAKWQVEGSKEALARQYEKQAEGKKF